jgi:hypothetical protein
MAAAVSNKKLLIILDCTSSMQISIDGIKKAIFQLFSIGNLCGSNVSIQFVLYRDYCINCCIWTTKISPVMTDCNVVSTFINDIHAARGGTDSPEASKTALFKALDLINEDTIVFFYTDALPHNDIIQTANARSEVAAIGYNNFMWSTIVNHEKYKMLRDKNQIYMITTYNYSNLIFAYSNMATMVYISTNSSIAITNASIGIWLNLIGVPFTQDSSVLTSFNVIKYLFGKIEYVSFTNNFYPFPCIESMRVNISDIITKFRTDETFMNMVFSILNKIIHPDYVMSLTTNDIFGKLWRECCKKRDHPMIANLQSAISTCCSATSLCGDYNAPAKLKKWVANSYDNTEDIMTYFSEVMDKFTTHRGKRSIPILVSDLPQMSRDDILDIGRGVATPTVIKTITNFLINTRVIYYYPNPADMDHPDDSNIPFKTTTLPANYVPTCMPDNKFFSHLSHLMCPGTLFSMKASAIMAIVAYLSENPNFVNRADHYLNGLRGRWLSIDKIDDNPELLNASFVKLVERVPMFLTDKENAFYKKYQSYVRLKSVMNLDVNMRLSWIPLKNTTYCDFIYTCKSCNFNYPQSLMITTNPDNIGVCAMCTDADITQFAKAGKYHNAVCDSGKSYLVVCSNSDCRGIYAIQSTDALKLFADNKLSPKCYYCRIGDKSISHNVECNSCHNKFVIPDTTLLTDLKGDYKCSVCTITPAQSVVDKTTTLGSLVQENSDMKLLFGVNPDTNLSIQGSLFKNRDNIIDYPIAAHAIPAVAAAAAPSTVPSTTYKITHSHRHIHNTDELCTKLPGEVLNGDHTTDCMICGDTTHISNLYSMCGHCNNKVCKSCGEKWYGSITKGNLIQPSRLRCAFCSKVPKFPVIRYFNITISSLMGARCKLFDSNYYYAWCTRCNYIKTAGDVACAAMAEPNFHGCFECDDCRIAIVNAQPDVDMKLCPNAACGIATEKTSGCNHITCPNCTTHWCYVCMAIFPGNHVLTNSEQDIYRHMYEAHGGWYDNAPNHDNLAYDAYN